MHKEKDSFWQLPALQLVYSEREGCELYLWTWELKLTHFWLQADCIKQITYQWKIGMWSLKVPNAYNVGMFHSICTFELIYPIKLVKAKRKIKLSLKMHQNENAENKADIVIHLFFKSFFSSREL